MQLDFMLCADLFMTPTAELADIVLPAAHWPEIDQLAGLPTVAANVVLSNQKSVQIGEQWRKHRIATATSSTS